MLKKEKEKKPSMSRRNSVELSPLKVESLSRHSHLINTLARFPITWKECVLKLNLLQSFFLGCISMIQFLDRSILGLLSSSTIHLRGCEFSINLLRSCWAVFQSSPSQQRSDSIYNSWDSDVGTKQISKSLLQQYLEKLTRKT